MTLYMYSDISECGRAPKYTQHTSLAPYVSSTKKGRWEAGKSEALGCFSRDTRRCCRVKRTQPKRTSTYLCIFSSSFEAAKSGVARGSGASDSPRQRRLSAAGHEAEREEDLQNLWLNSVDTLSHSLPCRRSDLRESVSSRVCFSCL